MADLHFPLPDPLRRMSRRCKSSVMGLKIDIDEVFAAQKVAEETRVHIRKKINDLEKLDGDMQAEIDDYETTIRTLRRLMPKVEAGSTGTEQDDSDEDGGLPRGTLRNYIETTLNTFAREGKTVGEIRDYIRNRYSVDVQPNTTSVTLNRLKARGIARLVGQDWSPALVTHVDDAGTPDWRTVNPQTAGGDLDDDIPF